MTRQFLHPSVSPENSEGGAEFPLVKQELALVYVPRPADLCIVPAETRYVGLHRDGAKLL